MHPEEEANESKSTRASEAVWRLSRRLEKIQQAEEVPAVNRQQARTRDKGNETGTCV